MFLHPYYTQLGGLGPFAAGLTSLKVIRCRIRSLAGLEGCKSLRFLWLDDNMLTDVDLLASLPNLELVSLSDNRLTTDSMLRLRPTGIRALNLAGNNIVSCNWVQKHKRLEYLDLSRTRISYFQLEVTVSRMLRALDLSASRIASTAVIKTLLVRTFPNIRSLTLRSRAGDCPFVSSLTESGYLASIFYLVVQNNLPLEWLDGKPYSPRDVIASSGLVRTAPDYFRYCIQRERVAQALRKWQRYALERLGVSILALQGRYFELKTDLQDIALLLKCHQAGPLSPQARHAKQGDGVVGSAADMKRAAVLRGDFTKVCAGLSALQSRFHACLSTVSQALYMHDQVLLGEFLSFGGISMDGDGSSLPLNLFADEAMHQALSYYAVGGQLRAYVKNVSNRALTQLYERRLSEMLEIGDKRIVPCGKELYEALIGSAGEGQNGASEASQGDNFVLVKVNGDEVTQLFGPDIQAETGVMALTALVRPATIPGQLEKMAEGSVLSYLALRVCKDTLASGVLDARVASFKPVFTIAFVKPDCVEEFARAEEYLRSFSSTAEDSAQDPEQASQPAQSDQSGPASQTSPSSPTSPAEQARWFPPNKIEYIIAKETLRAVSDAEKLLSELLTDGEIDSLRKKIVAAITSAEGGPNAIASMHCGDLFLDPELAKRALSALWDDLRSSLHPLVNLIPSLESAGLEKAVAERIALTTAEGAKITCLDLHNCGLKGDIRNLLDQFEGLRSLSLANNALSSLEIHQQELQQLDLSGNMLEACFVDSPALELLDISGNAFPTPDVFLRCLSAKTKGALIHLVVFGNPLCGNPLDASWVATLVRYLPRLRTIDGCHLRPKVAWDKVCCPDTLFYNMFSDPTPHSGDSAQSGTGSRPGGETGSASPWFRLDVLLDLPLRVVSSTLPYAKDLARIEPALPALGTKLDLAFTGLLELPRELLGKTAPQITEVSLRSCPFPRFGALAAFQEVQSLNLSDCKVTSDMLAELLPKLPRLQFLDVSRNRIDSLSSLEACSKTLAGLNASSNVCLDINTLPDLPALSFLSICEVASDVNLVAITVSTRCPHLTHLHLDLPNLPAAPDDGSVPAPSAGCVGSAAPPAIPLPSSPQQHTSRRASSAASAVRAPSRSSSRTLSSREEETGATEATPLDALDGIPPVLFLLPLSMINSISVNPSTLSRKRFTFIGNVNMSLLRSCRCLSRSAKLESASKAQADAQNAGHDASDTNAFPPEGIQPPKAQSTPSARKRGVSDEILKAFPPRVSVPCDVLTLTSLNLQSLVYERAAAKSMSHITTIFAGHNSLTSLAPLRDYPSLIQIDVRDNQISAPFENLCSETLEALNLTSNPIQSLRVSGSLVPNLRCLILRNCGLTILPANFLSAIGGSLVYLDISDNPLQDLSRSCLGGLASLHILKCENCGLRSLEFLDVLAAYDCLQTLDIRKNKVQNADKAFASLRRHKTLVRLLSADNPFTMREKEPADRRFKVFCEVPQVEELDGIPRTVAEQKRVIEYAKKNMEYAREHQPSILNFTMGSPTPAQAPYSVTPTLNDDTPSPRYRGASGERRASPLPRASLGPQKASQKPAQLPAPQFSGGLYPSLPPVAARSRTPGDAKPPDRTERTERTESSSRSSQRSSKRPSQTTKGQMSGYDHMPEIAGARKTRKEP